MSTLLKVADYTELINCKCQICKMNTARYSFFNGVKNSDIVLGDDKYIPVCESCYNLLSKK